MIHCHNLPHEDHDMMTQFRVGDDRPDNDPMNAARAIKVGSDVPVIPVGGTVPTSTTAAPAPTTTTTPPTTSPGTLTITEARHRVGKEFRCRGTAAASATVTVRDADRQTIVGTAAAAAFGAWEVRLKPGPAVQVGNVLVQSSTGGEARSAVANG